MNKNIVSLLFSLCFFLSSYSQELEEGQYAINYDTTYIQDYRQRLSLSTLFEFQNYFIAVFREGQEFLQFTSNLPKPTYGINGSYKWLNFAVSLAIPKMSIANTNFEESEGISIAFRQTLRRFYFSTFYEEYKGYRLINPDLVNNVTDQIEYPGLKTQTFFNSIYYGVNHDRFSYRNLIFQNEQQTKSAGSVLIGLSGGFKWINTPSDKPIIPDTSDTPNGLVGIEYFNIGINVGYAYTFVLHERFNASLMFVPGIQYLDGIYKFQDGTQNDVSTRLGLNAETRFQVGYNSRNFFGGISLTSYVLSNWINEVAPVGSLHNYIRLNLGYHFHLKPIKALKPFGLSN
jgi:hypothetical protein